jgi:NLR family CARD domain-containing protein 3
LKVNETLKELRLDSNQKKNVQNFGTSGRKEIFEALQKSSKLETLSLQFHFAGDGLGSELATLFEENKTLTSIMLGNNDLTSKGIENLLKEQKTKDIFLKKLDLRFNDKLKAEGAKHLAEFMKKCPRLTFLNLKECKIGSTGLVLC